VPRDFPVRKQPHPKGCLPTCVQAVLASYGEHYSYDEVAEWCRELPQGGCFWSDSLPGLTGQGYTVNELAVGDETAAEALTKLRDAVEVDSQVVIAELGFDVGTAGHAVVVIELAHNDAGTGSELDVIYMDPDRGEILQMPMATFLKKWAHRDYQSCVILNE